jgi:DUF917 family protein
MIAPTRFSVKVTWYDNTLARHDSIVHVESVGVKDAKRYAREFVSAYGAVAMMYVTPLNGPAIGVKAAWYRF